MSFKSVWNRYNRWIGINASDVDFDIYRPDYTANDQAGSLIATGKSVRYDPGNKFAEPPIQQGFYYDLFLDRKLVLPGDLLVPTGYSPSSVMSPVPWQPCFTILQYSDQKACVGLLTDHLGVITFDVETPVYSNVRFSWGREATPKPGRNRLIEDSMPFPRQTVIMYRRQGIGQPTALQKGMRLVETLDGLQHYYMILEVHSTGNQTVLTLEEDGL
jgi:hypothetical protein